MIVGLVRWMWKLSLAQRHGQTEDGVSVAPEELSYRSCNIDLNPGRLSEVLFDFNGQRLNQLSSGMLLDRCFQTIRHPMRDQLGRRIGDWHEDAVLTREDPPAVLELCRDFSIIRRHVNSRMIRRQENSMVELQHQFLCLITQGDEIENITVLIERTGDFDADSPVMSMQPFAGVAVKSDEMRRAEDQMVLRHADSISFLSHIGNLGGVH